MKIKLLLGLALILSGGLFGCSTSSRPHVAITDEPKLYVYDKFDPMTGLPTDKGEKRRTLSPTEEKRLRAELFKISRIIDRVIYDSTYANWERRDIKSEQDIYIRIPNGIPTGDDLTGNGLISDFYYSLPGGSGTGFAYLDRGDCRIAVRAYFQEYDDKVEKFDAKSGQHELPSQNVFRQTLKGTDIVIEVNVVTKDAAFVEQLHKKLNE